MSFLHKLFCLVIVAVALCACEEMFYHEVDFRVEGGQPKLVLLAESRVGNIPAYQVTHTKLLDENTGSQPYYLLMDADVRFRRNGGEWIRLYTLNDTSIYCLTENGALPPAIGPLDTIELKVSHPDYPSLYARQVMPDYAYATLTQYEKQDNNSVLLTLHIEPYRGNADDMIAIRSQMWNVYSVDSVFAKAQNMQAGAYYGADETYSLFFPAALLSRPLDIQLFADGGKPFYTETDTIFLTPRNLSLTCSVLTHDGYLNELFRRTYTQTELDVPSWVPRQSGNWMQIILEGVTEILGQQELLSVYTNVEGGLGYLFGWSSMPVGCPNTLYHVPSRRM